MTSFCLFRGGAGVWNGVDDVSGGMSDFSMVSAPCVYVWPAVLLVYGPLAPLPRPWASLAARPLLWHCGSCSYSTTSSYVVEHGAEG